jgi:hypothetical protein
VEVGTPGRAGGAAFAQVREGGRWSAGATGPARSAATAAPGTRPVASSRGGWGRAALRVSGGQITLSLNGRPVASVRAATPPAGPVTSRAAAGLGLRNVFARALKP